MSTPTDLAPAIQTLLAAGAAGSEKARIPHVFDATYRRSDGATVTIPVAYIPGESGESGEIVPVLDENAISQAFSREAPAERSGLFRFSDLGSLLAWGRRYATTDTVAYILAPSPNNGGEIRVVVDDLPATGAGARREVQGAMPMGLSRQLTTWLAASGKDLPAETFIDHVEDNAVDLADTALESMLNNIAVKIESSWQRTVVDGKVRVQVDDQSGPATPVPARFKIRVPVFATDAASDVMEFEFALRARVVKGKLVFKYRALDFEACLESAVAAAVMTIEGALPGVPVFKGGFQR